MKKYNFSGTLSESSQRQAKDVRSPSNMGRDRNNYKTAIPDRYGGAFVAKRSSGVNSTSRNGGGAAITSVIRCVRKLAVPGNPICNACHIG